VFWHVESQRFGERPSESTSQQALLLAQTKFLIEDVSQVVKK